MICTLTDLCIYYIMSGDIAAQGFRQVCADFKRKDTVQMIPIVIMAIEDESDRDYITGLFLKNERGMYAMALKIVKEHHTACYMVSEACLKMIEKIGYLREISVQKQTSYILSIVKNTSLMYLRQRHSENCYLVDDERILDCAATSQDDLDAALISEAESQVIRQALKRLKPRDRDLLEMKYFSQLDDKKISQQLRISRNSVRYYLTLARRALKDEIKKGDSSHV